MTEPVKAILSAVATWLDGLPASYSGWNPHDEQFDSGAMNEREQLAAKLRAATTDDCDNDVSMLRELISDGLSGLGKHWSSCAVYNAPAELPGLCNCDWEAK